ncbi:MAG TPA: 4Fe-4S binding protein [Thermoanaerobacterales bacterium]|nr:4Fe-4S binding protein [Thermoanaerobacterales bacterium]
MLGNIKSVLLNLAKKPVTRMYPDVKRNYFENTRGHLINDMEKCVLCGICQRVCPSNCIKVNRDEARWEYNPFECVLCGVCVERCVKKSLKLDSAYRQPASSKYRVELLMESREEGKAAGKVKSLA